MPASGGRDGDHLAGRDMECHAGRPRAAGPASRPAAVDADRSSRPQGMHRDPDALIDPGDRAADADRRGHRAAICRAIQGERGVISADDLPGRIPARAKRHQVDDGGRADSAIRPLDADRHWSRNLVVPGAEVKRRIEARWPLRQIPHAASETARKYRFADGAPGEIGLINPVTEPFCGHCSRIRVTADGKLRTCLFSRDDHDLRPLLRNGASDAKLANFIEERVSEKEQGHRINEPGFVPPSRTMVYIGG